MCVYIEAQNVFNPGYPLVTRGFYYDARMISAQYGREFTNSEYGKIKKVYSVWVCIDPDVNHRNTITRFHTVADNIFGNAESMEEDYNKMEVILIGLQTDEKTESENSLIDMLSTLFSKNMKADDKRKKLENKHGIKMKKEYREVVENMCNISGYYSKDYDDAMRKLEKAEKEKNEAVEEANKAEKEKNEAVNTIKKQNDEIEQLKKQLAYANRKAGL